MYPLTFSTCKFVLKMQVPKMICKENPIFVDCVYTGYISNSGGKDWTCNGMLPVEIRYSPAIIDKQIKFTCVSLVISVD